MRAIIDAATERERLARADRQRCQPGGGTQDAKSQASATGSAAARNVDYTRVTGLSTSEGGRDRIESLIASTAAMERRAEARRAELDRVRQGEQERSAAEDAERLRETISHYVQAGEVERRTNGAECEMSEIHRLRAELGREQARAYVLESHLFPGASPSGPEFRRGAGTGPRASPSGTRAGSSLLSLRSSLARWAVPPS